MGLFDDLIASLPDGRVRDVRVGAYWTATVVVVGGESRCGLASTLRDIRDHHHGRGKAVRDAGQLINWSTRRLAELVCSERQMEAAIGMATINALLPAEDRRCLDLNAEEVIAQHGNGKRVVLVGHFPFIRRLREHLETLWVLEQQPRGQDLPADAAEEVIPQADLLAITGTALINHTFESLMALRRPGSMVLVLGPSTPLSPILFNYGVDLVSGSVVEDIESVLRAVSQGANFHQVRRQGVRLVTMQRGNSEAVNPQ